MVVQLEVGQNPSEAPVTVVTAPGLIQYITVLVMGLIVHHFLLVKPVKPKSSWFILNVLVKSQVFSRLASHFIDSLTFLVDSENHHFKG